MKAMNVRADEVRVGDEIWNGRAGVHPSWRWLRVISVETFRGYFVLETPYWATWKHPAEGVAIRRAE